MAVIADFEHYPEWVDSMKSAEVLTSVGRQGRDSADGARPPLVKDDYVLAYDWQPTKVSWHLVEGTLLKAMDGSYALEPKGAATTVTYHLTST